MRVRRTGLDNTRAKHPSDSSRHGSDLDELDARIHANGSRMLPKLAGFGSGYSCYPDRPYSCVSTVPMSSSVKGDVNNGCSTKNESFTVLSVGPALSLYAVAPCLMLLDDLPHTGASTTTSSASATGIAAPDTKSPDAGLSTGAIAAIGSCVPLVAIAAGLALFFFFRRRSRRAAAPSASGDDAGTGAELPGPEIAAMGESDPRHSFKSGQTSLGPGSPVLDRSGTVSRAGESDGRLSELYGSAVQRRLHEDIMELPGENSASVVEKPVPETPS
ncbi:hypothetical protein IF1G_10400 [Cordyceps javanica]|uniref:Uncharacterized protein n=1 Tax=Cordyceps javanica TaxID=43265 RepID=A0A545VLR5_9HYPO|nr:hypothetical protein IF1G_10400 [Cordyceps javanica]TQW02630.1 transmembrane alpha-helix domain-containing protein [Cordyceps javanica]